MVFVTTDPNRDSPRSCAVAGRNFNPSFIGLTGTDRQITAAEVAVGMPPAEVVPLGNGNYSVDHAADVLAFTPTTKPTPCTPTDTHQRRGSTTYPAS